MEIKYPSATYSLLNLLFISFVFSHKYTVLYPIAITNTCSIIFTWYLSIIFLDHSLPQRLMEKYNWSLTIYTFGELVLHIIPYYVVISYWRGISRYQLNILANESTYCDLIHQSGLYSLTFNLLWSIFYNNGFEANDNYVFMFFKDWNIVWTLNAITHLVSMHLLNESLF